MSPRSIKYPSRFPGLPKSRCIEVRAMSATWHGQKGHIGRTPKPTGLRKLGPRMPCRSPPLNLRARSRSIECRWAPDVESKLGQTTPVSSAELEAVCQLLGEDLDRLLRD